MSHGQLSATEHRFADGSPESVKSMCFAQTQLAAMCPAGNHGNLLAIADRLYHIDRYPIYRPELLLAPDFWDRGQPIGCVSPPCPPCNNDATPLISKSTL